MAGSAWLPRAYQGRAPAREWCASREEARVTRPLVALLNLKVMIDLPRCSAEAQVSHPPRETDSGGLKTEDVSHP